MTSDYDELVDGTPTPMARVRRMKRILAQFFDADEHGELYTPCVDLIADLMHLVEVEDLDLDGIMESATMHFEAERNEN